MPSRRRGGPGENDAPPRKKSLSCFVFNRKGFFMKFIPLHYMNGTV